MIDRLNEMMKSIVENGYYSEDTVEVTMKVRNGYKTLEIVDFCGLGLTWQEAFDDLHNNYIEFMKEEDKKEAEIIEAMNI